MNRLWVFCLLGLLFVVSVSGLGFIGWMISARFIDVNDSFLFVLAIFGLVLASVFVVLVVYALFSGLFLDKTTKIVKIFKRTNIKVENRYLKSISQVVPSEE